MTTVPVWLTISGLGFNLCFALYLPVLNIYMAELFPTKSRSTLTPGAWSISRIAAAITPLLLLPLLQDVGLKGVFLVIIGAAAVSLVVILVFGPRGETGRCVT
jgi:putative MFS transporter